MSKRAWIIGWVGIIVLLGGCDFLEQQQERLSAMIGKKKPSASPSVEKQIETIQQEMATLQREREEIEQKSQQIRSEQETLNKLLQETEAEIERLEVADQEPADSAAAPK
jgi:uncharacterized protein YlxW (UPF0749 family)